MLLAMELCEALPGAHEVNIMLTPARTAIGANEAKAAEAAFDFLNFVFCIP